MNSDAGAVDLVLDLAFVHAERDCRSSYVGRPGSRGCRVIVGNDACVVRSSAARTSRLSLHSSRSGCRAATSLAGP